MLLVFFFVFVCVVVLDADLVVNGGDGVVIYWRSRV